MVLFYVVVWKALVVIGGKIKTLVILYFQFHLSMVEVEEAEDPERVQALEEKMKLCLEKEKANPDALNILARIACQR